MISHTQLCLHCKYVFVSKRSDAKYCSTSCRVLACIERQKKYWQEEMEKQKRYDEEQFKRYQLREQQKGNQVKQNEQNVSSISVQNNEEPIISDAVKDLQEWIKTSFENLKRENQERTEKENKEHHSI